MCHKSCLHHSGRWFCWQKQSRHPVEAKSKLRSSLVSGEEWSFGEGRCKPWVGWAREGRVGARIWHSGQILTHPTSAQSVLHRPLRFASEVLLAQIWVVHRDGWDFSRGKGKISSYPKVTYSSHLTCIGYSTDQLTCLFQHRLGLEHIRVLSSAINGGQAGRIALAD